MTGSDATIHGLPYVEAAGPSLTLTVAEGPDQGQVIPCRRIVTLIGSRAGCKIRLNHPLVAPVHVALVNDGSDVYAVDLVTRHGTMLNDLRMEFERLSDGDMMFIDPWLFRIGVDRRRAGGEPDAPIALEFAPNVIALEHLESGRILRPNRKVCTIGRRSGCDIQVEDASVSRAHALLFMRGDDPVVVDLLSRNGTSVNDEPVAFRALRDHDVIRVGDARFRLRIVVPSAGNPQSKPARDVTPPGTSAPPAGGNGRPDATPPEKDLIDIQAVEGAQRWHIAEKLEQTQAASAKRRVAR